MDGANERTGTYLQRLSALYPSNSNIFFVSEVVIMTFILKPQPLTAEAFAPFGEVVEAGTSTPIMINDGNTERYDSLVKVQTERPEDTAVINIFRAQPRMTKPLLNRPGQREGDKRSMLIKMMERHPRGSQSFHPLSGEPYLVLVADAVEELTPENLHLFLAQPNQGINYRMNTWHHPVLGLNKVCDFLVVDRKGEGNNCEEFYFNQDELIEIQL